jgi:hypothetical protein
MIAMTLNAGCVNIANEEVVADRSAASRKACASALAAGVITKAQEECLTMLDVLSAGFGE